MKVLVKEKIGDSGVQLLRDAGLDVELGVDWELGPSERFARFAADFRQSNAFTGFTRAGRTGAARHHRHDAVFGAAKARRGQRAAIPSPGRAPHQLRQAP